ncbi:MAG: hypothetical protein P8P74_08840 [Crocinitomicaceae bacterium]|nr:hypothetical protein [Crocinitomicaceae bacterium]
MNKILVIVFVLTGAVRLHAQSENRAGIERLMKITDRATFPEFWSEFEPFKDSLSNEIAEGNLRPFNNRNSFRRYGFRVMEYKFNFQEITEVEGSSFRSKNYRLRILFDQKDSTIFYCRLVEFHGYGRDEYISSSKLKFDSTKFETCFARHDSLYNTNTLRNFSSPPFISHNYYGPICMNHGSDQHDEMLAAVKNNQKQVLLNWIRSFNIEDKAFGAAGLYFLRKEGVTLTEEEQRLLEFTQKLRVNVQTDLRIDLLGLVLSNRALDKRFENYVED